jgi:hypothetical protein
VRFLVRLVDPRSPHLPPKLYVEAESFHDAKEWARVQYPIASVTLVRRGDEDWGGGDADVVLRWVGSDAGPRPDRRLEIEWRLCRLCYGLTRPALCEACGGSGRAGS